MKLFGGGKRHRKKTSKSSSKKTGIFTWLFNKTPKTKKHRKRVRFSRRIRFFNKSRRHRRKYRGGDVLESSKNVLNNVDQKLGDLGTSISNTTSSLWNNIKNKFSSTQTAGRQRKRRGGGFQTVSNIPTAKPMWVNSDGPDVPANWYRSGGKRQRTKTKRTKRKISKRKKTKRRKY